MFIVESDFEYNGYRCVTIFGDLGHRCGYVGVPVGHPLYGKECDDQIDILFSEIEGEPIGKRGVIPLVLAASDPEEKVRMDLYFNVHGSLTYAGENHPVESDLWWLGFDCGHAGDRRDLDKVLELWGNNPRIQQRIEIDKQYPFDKDYPIRELDYVQQECRNLVDQIIEYCKRK